MTTSIVAGPGDTWGIPGPQFLWLYFCLATAAILAVLIWRRTYTRGPSLRNARDLTATQAALLNGNGDARLPVYSSLAALRAAGAVETEAGGRLRQTGPAPTGASELDRVVHALTRNGISITGILTHANVRDVINRTEAELAAQGWVLDDTARRGVRLGALVVFAVLVIGVARVVAGLDNNKPVINLVLMLIPVAIVAFALLSRPRITSAGKKVLAKMRRDVRHLAPSESPSWSTYGPQAAALSVGLFGVGAFWLADPTFAQAAELQRNVAQTGYYDSSSSSSSSSSSCSSSSSSCSSSSSSCSSGSSCGGGCGGGGCGG